jgi:hypothetical protein
MESGWVAASGIPSKLMSALIQTDVADWALMPVRDPGRTTGATRVHVRPPLAVR